MYCNQSYRDPSSPKCASTVGTTTVPYVEASFGQNSSSATWHSYAANGWECYSIQCGTFNNSYLDTQVSKSDHNMQYLITVVQRNYSTSTVEKIYSTVTQNLKMHIIISFRWITAPIHASMQFTKAIKSLLSPPTIDGPQRRTRVTKPTNKLQDS